MRIGINGKIRKKIQSLVIELESRAKILVFCFLDFPNSFPFEEIVLYCLNFKLGAYLNDYVYMYIYKVLIYIRGIYLKN